MTQTDTACVEGNYFLTGVHEVASVLVLKSDQSFSFLYFYGTLDRSGIGSWQFAGHDSATVLLNSKARPEADFALLRKTVSNSQATTIKIIDTRTELLRYVTVRLHTHLCVKDKFTDAKGMVTIPRQAIRKIELLFELCPDRFSSFEVQDPELNDFEFRFEPWITDIFFENLALTVNGNRLTGNHPLSDGNYHYVRSEDAFRGW